ncbi:IbpA Molecular chaperone (small heat shock protein) [uncultured Caudovirales phage]|uniref:IbpA Molecular chaperone (Small heat shock protein) n=1 Tax=uncultured Caudovirales phage TaxID=2100421 RepID=A0A6J5TE36_9CAUD|nr:IbpA Molecular chaperone (small heat shock protein) [uncultured Caudovirales phage]CAB5219521.1 IbpA Molecular chaperone (small heat shock protein) [uncultured Caudovirales phage]
MVIVRDPFATLSQEFDKMFAQVTKPVNNYPPHNLIKFGEDAFLMQFAVAGFTKGDIEITTHKGNLTITGEKKELELSEDAAYIHKGIAARKFIRNFLLPEYTDVTKATVEDGILSIELTRSVPEEQKPKTINIK